MSFHVPSEVPRKRASNALRSHIGVCGYRWSSNLPIWRCFATAQEFHLLRSQSSKSAGSARFKQRHQCFTPRREVNHATGHAPMGEFLPVNLIAAAPVG